MKKDYLRYILSILLKDFESFATSEQISTFKRKHAGVKWQKDLETDLLIYADNSFKLERWIGNVVTFMMEHNIDSNMQIKNNNQK